MNTVNWEQLLDKPRMYVDLNAGGPDGSTFVVPLDSRHLAQSEVTPCEGLTVALWTDDGDDQGNPDPMVFEGTLQRDPEERHRVWSGWVAVIPEESICHMSDSKAALLEPVAA